MFIDSGPVVAFLNRNDEWHGWAREQFKRFSEFTTCDAVLAEVCARLHYEGLDQWKALDLLAEGALVLDFDLGAHQERVGWLRKSIQTCRWIWRTPALLPWPRRRVIAWW